MQLTGTSVVQSGFRGAYARISQVLHGYYIIVRAQSSTDSSPPCPKFLISHYYYYVGHVMPLMVSAGVTGSAQHGGPKDGKYAGD
jgi:hypothetical protein